MARLAKKGVEYFPLDVDMFQDIRVRKLIKRQNGSAVAVYTLLLCYIYKDGYYMRWDPELPFILSEQTGFEEGYILEVMRACVAVGLFDRAILEKNSVLTSAGIQRRFCAIKNLHRRRVQAGEYWLLQEDQEEPAGPAPQGTKPKRKPRKAAERKASGPTPKQGEATPPLPATPPDDSAPQAAGEPEPKAERLRRQHEKYLEHFFSDKRRASLEVLSSGLGMPADNFSPLRSLARQVVSEWLLAEIDHENFTDWSRHLISTLRIKASAGRGNKPAQKTPNPAKPTPQADYSYRGGFGSKDV